MRKAFANFSYSNRFQGVVAGAVILNAIQMGIQCYRLLQPTRS